MDRERGGEQHRNEVDAAEGEAQQNEQTSGDEQSVPEEPDIEVEREASGDPSRTDRNPPTRARESVRGPRDAPA